MPLHVFIELIDQRPEGLDVAAIRMRVCQQTLLLRRFQHGQRMDVCIRIGSRRRCQPEQVPLQPLNPSLIEQVRVVVEVEFDSAVALAGSMQIEVVLRQRRCDELESRFGGFIVVDHVQHDLKQRRDRPRPSMLQVFHKVAERNVAVGQGVDARPMRFRDQFAKAQSGPAIQAQHHRIGEKSDYVFQAVATTISGVPLGEWNTDHGVAAVGMAREQNREQRMQHRK
ncbi:hypothetical protein NB696_002985 [Xanthomonas sacchari]|nr:hypothetical protein [Xanthomonas sacchari]MCW0446113.1 hypothetical protein [Xanthomonas sacchari]MCW0464629.1 hypothetical protein [Xanthomonas sacchari]